MLAEPHILHVLELEMNVVVPLCSSVPTHFVVFFQNIIKKVSGQKFVYKFVSQADPSLAEVVRSGEEGQRRDNIDPNSQSKGLGVPTSTCPSKALPEVGFFTDLQHMEDTSSRTDLCFHPQRSPPSSCQKSSRNDYMRSGLYSTFTIQSLQASPNPRPVKTELLLQQDPPPKVDRPPREVRDSSEYSEELSSNQSKKTFHPFPSVSVSHKITTTFSNERF